MQQNEIKNSTFRKRLFLPLGIVVVAIVFSANRVGFLPNFLVSTSTVP